MKVAPIALTVSKPAPCADSCGCRKSGLVGDRVVIVLPQTEGEFGSLVVVDNGASSFLWRGNVGAGGQVRELRVDKAS